MSECLPLGVHHNPKFAITCDYRPMLHEDENCSIERPGNLIGS